MQWACSSRWQASAIFSQYTHKHDAAVLANPRPYLLDGDDGSRLGQAPRCHRNALRHDGTVKTAPMEGPPTTMVSQRALSRSCSLSTVTRPEVVTAAAMSGELGHAVSGVMEALRDVAHLQWRPAQPMDEEEAETSSRPSEALIRARTAGTRLLLRFRQRTYLRIR